jgi:hypothetical protein
MTTKIRVSESTLTTNDYNAMTSSIYSISQTKAQGAVFTILDILIRFRVIARHQAHPMSS